MSIHDHKATDTIGISLRHDSKHSLRRQNLDGGLRASLGALRILTSDQLAINTDLGIPIVRSLEFPALLLELLLQKEGDLSSELDGFLLGIGKTSHHKIFDKRLIGSRLGALREAGGTMANGRNDLTCAIKSLNGTLDRCIVNKVDASSMSTTEENGISRGQVQSRNLGGVAEHSHCLGVDQKLLAGVREEALS